MKKLIVILLLLCVCASLFACGGKDKVDLTEDTFFYGMITIQMYPDEYIGKKISFDCFTYRLEDVEGNEYLCGVRKCSAGYGCKCGKDSVIGFILEYDGEIPEPKNQSVDTNDKTWIHVEGTLATAELTELEVFAYTEDGQIDTSWRDYVVFCTFSVSSLSLIEDYSGLAYYVTK